MKNVDGTEVMFDEFNGITVISILVRPKVCNNIKNFKKFSTCKKTLLSDEMLCLTNFAQMFFVQLKWQNSSFYAHYSSNKLSSIIMTYVIVGRHLRFWYFFKI